MPSNWLSMDDNFPTFTGNESPSQQIAALHDYLYQMREGLQYSMRNLTADNFNEAALQQLTEEQKNAVVEDLQKLIKTIDRYSSELSALSARVAGVEKLGTRVSTAEEEITYLQRDVEDLKEHEYDLAEMEKTTQELQEGQSLLEEQMSAAQAGIDELQEELQKVTDVTKLADDGSATIGGVGKKIYLVGEIYINGQLQGSGGEAT